MSSTFWALLYWACSRQKGPYKMKKNDKLKAASEFANLIDNM